MDQITTEKSTITEAERARRKEAIDFARGSVRLEGFHLGPDVEELNRRYIAGEMSSDEHSAAIRKSCGL
jgi:hypothetical protein